MKRTLSLLALFLLQFPRTQAQIDKDSYVKSIDLLNCRAVELTFKRNKEKLSSFNKSCPCDSTSFVGIQKYIKADGNPKATMDLSKEIDELKKEFRENWQKDDLITYLSEDVFNDKEKYPNIYAFSDRRKGKQELDSFKARIRNELNIKLIAKEAQPPPTKLIEGGETIISKEQVKIPPDSIIEKKGGEGMFGDYSDYLTLLSILLGTTALLVALTKPISERSYKAIRDRLIGSGPMNRHFHNKNMLSKSDTPKFPNTDYLERWVSTLESKIKWLEESIEISKAKVANSPNQTQLETKSEADERRVLIHEEQPQQTRVETLYMSSPNSDGSFDEYSASQTYREGATIYQFTKSNPNKAFFKIAEKDASIKLALQLRDKRIDPACEATNAFNHAKGLKTIQQVEAELVNGKWVVVTKARIQYES
jgi:hypothetical protein